MPVESDRGEGALVRCVDCHTVYDAAANAAGGTPHCPRCGGSGWLAATIPVAEDTVDT